MIRTRIFIILYFAFSFGIFAQNTTVKDTVMLGIQGLLTQERIILRDAEQYKFDFRSVNTNNVHRLLQVNGQFKNGVKEGRWTLVDQDFNYKINEISLLPQINAKLDIAGNEYQLHYGYRNGKPFGKWKLEKIDANEVVSEQRILFEGQFNASGFLEGKLIIAFYDGEFLNSVQAQLNEKGFFNGKQEFIYKNLGEIFREERTYDNGFLINLKQFNHQTKELLLNITYDDVISKLKEIRKSKESNFQISDRGFGSEFNVGYSKFDVQLTSQYIGNRLIDSIFSRIKKYDALGIDEANVVINLTRRFKIAYPESDSIKLAKTFQKNEKLRFELDSIVNNPRYILNQQKTRKLTEAFSVLSLVYHKTIKIDSLLRLNFEGDFDFISRDAYFMSGLPFLKVRDSVRFIFEGKEHTVPLDFRGYDNKNSFATNLFDYLDALVALSQERIDHSKSQLQQFDKEAKIEVLDSEILEKMLKFDTLFTPLQRIHEAKVFNERPFSYNIFESVKTRLITPNHKKYVDEKDLNKKIELGREMMCLLGFVLDHKDDILKFDLFKEDVDTMFTRFSENPFLDRMMENKVYPNIVRKSTDVLFTNYINGVFRSNSCVELEQNIMKIDNLTIKLKELSSKNDKSVMELDRVLRRENVPARIERIMELN